LGNTVLRFGSGDWIAGFALFHSGVLDASICASACSTEPLLLCKRLVQIKTQNNKKPLAKANGFLWLRVQG
jgi:hypothetical protein